jgi:hypothetical protein
VAGLRDLTTVFSGSRAVASLPRGLEAILGSAYLVLNMIAVLVVPTLLLAAALSAVATRIIVGRGGGCDRGSASTRDQSETRECRNQTPDGR